MSRRSLRTKRCRAGDRVKGPLDIGSDVPLGSPALGSRRDWLSGAGEVQEVGALGVVELQGLSQCFEDALGGSAEVSAFETGVVGDADAGEDGDLFATQPGNAATAVAVQPRLLGRDLSAPGGEELADLVLRLHAASVDRRRAAWETRAVPLSTGTPTFLDSVVL